jgi:3'(2'), 5'-bisphosphate nucleotidase
MPGMPSPADRDPDRDEDLALACDLATRSAALLLGVRAQARREGWDQDRLKAEGDRQSHELLFGELVRLRPDDVVLSEEGALDPARLEPGRRVWIVDPLDGTREFSEAGRDDWAVHVALAVGDQPVLAAVSLPAQGRVVTTGDVTPPPVVGRAPRVLVSRTRPPALAVQVAEAVGGELVPMGSAGAKVMAVVLGDADVYVHAGGQYEWDSCAPVAIARAAGLHTSRIDGSPLRYNQPDVSLPDLVVCSPALAGAVLAAIATTRTG